jgi:peptidyl-prolyl cis-trans isomerase SurA
MKRFCAFFLLGLVVLSAPARAAVRDDATGQRAGIAATVNDEVITVSDVENRMKLYLSGGQGLPPPEILKRMRAQILDKMIDEKLELREAKNLGITVSEAELKDAFAQISQQNHFSPEEFKQRLSAAGVRPATLQDQLKAEIAWSQVIRRRLRPEISISESDIDSTIEQISRNRSKPQYHVAEIYLAVPNPAQDAVVKSDAQKLVAQISGGAHFSDVARQFSQAPGAAAGGDLGWIQEGQLDPKLDVALKQMHAGQISPPVRTDGGYHILFLRDVQEPGAGAPTPSSAGVTPQPAALGPALHLKQIVIAVAADDPTPVLAAKMARAETLKGEISSCAAMDAKAKDFASEGTGDLGVRPLAALDPNVRAAVEGLKDGELSAPIRTDKGVAVLMICGREEGTAAAATPPTVPAVPDKNDQAARENVANKIGMQRLDQMQDRYLRDLRATAFIEKRL